MATLNKTSKLHSMISAMDDTEIAYLKSYLTTNSKVPTEKATLGANEATALVYYKGITGILKKMSASNYLLLSCGEKDTTIYSVIENNLKKIDEPITLLEVLMELIETEESGGDEWTNTMKTKLVYDDGTIENGVNFYVDGTTELDDEVTINDHFSIFSDTERIVDVNTDNKTTSIYRHLKVGSAETPSDLTVNGEVIIGDSSTVAHTTLLNVHADAQFHGEAIIDSLDHLQNTDGDALIKVIDKATFEGGSFVYKVGVVYVVYDTDGTCYVRYYVS